MIFQKKAKGFGLLEVLIATLVMSIGMLGAAVMQSKAMRLANKTRNATTALLLANDLSMSMATNPLEVATSSDVYGAYYVILKKISESSSFTINSNSTKGIDDTSFIYNPSSVSNASVMPRWLQDGTTSLSTKDCSETHPCWPAELAALQVMQFKDSVESSLPNGKISDFSHNSVSNEYNLQLQWTETDGKVSTMNYRIPIHIQADDLLESRLRALPFPLYQAWGDPASDTVPENIRRDWGVYLRSYFLNMKRPPSSGAVGDSLTPTGMGNLNRPYLTNANLINVCNDVFGTFATKVGFCSNR